MARDPRWSDGGPVAGSSPPGTSDEGAERPEARLPAAEPPRTGASEPPRDTASLLEGDAGAAPAPAPEATPDVAAARANPNIRIPESGVGTGVENHRLVGAGDRFPEGSEVVFWTNVVGGDSGNVIHHVWLHEGRGIARIPLTIGGLSVAHLSRRPLPPGAAGRWVVEARGLDGRLLARQGFLCVPPGALAGRDGLSGAAGRGARNERREAGRPVVDLGLEGLPLAHEVAGLPHQLLVGSRRRAAACSRSS